MWDKLSKYIICFRKCHGTQNPLLVAFIFYKQTVYKQLALRWQIPEQLSGLNPRSLSKNKNCRLKKRSFSFAVNAK